MWRRRIQGQDRPDIPENKKPTPAQQKARLANIKKSNRLDGQVQRRKVNLRNALNHIFVLVYFLEARSCLDSLRIDDLDIVLNI
jgi:hypothetical protein